LIQTIGRAARHLRGRAILYADRITGSMQRAIAETDRRREKQMAHNEKYNITPIGITKSISDVMEGYSKKSAGERAVAAIAAQEIATYQVLSPTALKKKIAELETKMYQHAKDLEFEAAAKIRDQLQKLYQQNFGA
jgi:excinuclease ABC subunit B